MTNQTQIISTMEITGNPVAGITTDVNAFIVAKLAQGCSNFDIKQVQVETAYNDANQPIKSLNYVVQINYYDPSKVRAGAGSDFGCDFVYTGS